MSFIEHLLELRDRILRALLAVVVILLVLTPFYTEIYEFVARPLLKHLPEGATMIATEVASPFLTPFKLAFFVSVFLAMPFMLYQFWAFVAPGLYRHERRLVFPLMITSSILFYLGGAFAYFIVFPLVFAFFTSAAPEGVTVMTDIARYLDFVLKVFFAFGIAFEVPIVAIILVWTGATTPEKLVAKRPYVIVGAFVIGMLLTPPDIISQTLLAVPVWILFEVGVFVSRTYVGRGMGARTEDAYAEDPEEAGTDSDSDPDSNTDSEWREMSEDEMDAELDRIEAEEDEPVDRPTTPGSS